MDRPRIYADLMKCDARNAATGTRRVRLTTLGTRRDMQRHGIEFESGKVLDFWTDDADDDNALDPLVFSGPVFYDGAQGHWYALINDAEISHASETNKTLIRNYDDPITG